MLFSMQIVNRRLKTCTYIMAILQTFSYNEAHTCWASAGAQAMFHEVEFLPEFNACIVTFQQGWHTKEGTAERADIVQRALEQADESLTFIFDLTHIKMRFDGVMRAANSLARGPNAPFHHPLCKQIIVVTANSMVQKVAHGLQTETFGSLPVCVRRSREEALNEACKQD